MRFFQDDDYLKVSRITGPAHNLLGLRFGDAAQSDPPIVEIPSVSFQEELDIDAALTEALAGVDEANEVFGTTYRVVAILILKDDSPPAATYRMLAFNLVERLVKGLPFVKKSISHRTMEQLNRPFEEIQAGLPKEKLLELISHENQSVRGAAIGSLTERFGSDPSIVHNLAKFIEDVENRKPAMGTIRLSHYAMKLLKTLPHAEANAAFDSIVKAWPEEDRADLEWFLERG